MDEVRRTPRRPPRMHLFDAAPEWLTRRQAATIAGTTTRTVDRWRRSGKLPSYRLGDGAEYRPVLISRDGLRKLLSVAPSDR